MFSRDQYQLIRFGGQQKLEDFGGVKVCRRAPAAAGSTFASPKCFQFHGDGKWTGDAPDNWKIKHGDFQFILKPTPFGHLGVFPEQAANWDWIADLPLDLEGCQAINLFAHTGGTTMALAGRGANVVHLDSAKNVVGWARENAGASGLADAPIRWIVDDAMKFLRRELKRGRRYDFIVADPPSFGHGLKKSSWKFDRDIDDLLDVLRELASDNLMGLLVTCHTTGYSESDLFGDVKRHFKFLASRTAGKTEIGEMTIAQHDGSRHLHCGHFLRWYANDENQKNSEA